ncbi:MAG: CBS domain-containing protein [Promethearchaeota archaeon]
MISRYVIPQEQFLINQENQLSDAIAKLRTANIEQLFVIDDNKRLLGLICPYDLFDQPMWTKMSSLMRPCPYLTSKEEINVYDLIDLILAEQSMKSIPFCDNAQVKEIWSPYDILYKILRMNLLKGRIIANLLEKEENLIVKEKDPISIVKAYFKQSKADFVIIVNENNTSVSLITEKMLLEKVNLLKQSIKGKKGGKGERIITQLRPEEISISEITQTVVPEVSSSMKLNTLITEMIRNRSLRTLVRDNSEFKGVVTYEQILQYVLDQRIILMRYILHKAVRNNFSANKR